MDRCPFCNTELPEIKPSSKIDSPPNPETGLDYRHLFEANRAVMLMIDPESGRIVDANPAACLFYGHSLKRLTEMRITDINTLPPERTRDRMGQARETQKNVFRFKHRLASGDIRDVDVFSSPVQIENRTLLFSIIHDITGQIETENLLRSVFESSPDLVLLIDRQLRILLSNWKRREFVPVEERTARPRCHKAFMNRDIPCEPCFALEVFKSGKPKVYERYNPNPAVGHIEVRAYPIFDQEGNVAMVAEHVRDINDRKKAEREKAELQSKLYQAQKMESVGTLAGGIAHDFNNLLMAILGNVSLMQPDALPNSPLAEGLKHIEEYVRKGSDLTRQLLGFAQGGKYEVMPTDLNAMIKTGAEMFGRTRKDIRIDIELTPDIPPVEVDRGQIDQVFLNILVNAGQAMPKGGKIFIETLQVNLDGTYTAPYGLEAGPYVKVVITDTGPGMDEKTRQRIFDPFFTTKGMGEGTGLGLASAYGIVKNHGGIINAYSEPGQGATFSIYLPASQLEVAAEKIADDRIAVEGLTILLVDDEDMVLHTASRMLTRSGCTVLRAASGEEALRIYLENQTAIDLVILDMVMPGMDGGEVFDRLREANPCVRVILSSGYSINGQATRILDRGCDGFIQKPFTLSELTRKIQKIMAG